MRSYIIGIKMDFSPITGQEPKAKLKKSKNKLLILIILVILAVTAALAFYLTQQNKNPLPADIKSQISFKVIYPSSKSGKLTRSYQYQYDQKILIFGLNKYGTNIVFTEQVAPSTVGSGGQVYYQALGLHPYAQFQSKIALVALAKFYHSGSLKPAGQTAIMATAGTLLTAHPDKDLTNAQWKDLFDSLKIAK